MTRREPHFGNDAPIMEPLPDLSTQVPNPSISEHREGRIKHYSREKGFGFIHDDVEKVDRYFLIRSVCGGYAPNIGDMVKFLPKSHKRGPRAEEVVVIMTAEEQREERRREERPDYRERCNSCGKLMVPRISFCNGSPNASYCPFCGKQHKNFGPCFIASAVYGDAMAIEVDTLRYIRDHQLKTRILGRVFVKIYYYISPPLAVFIKFHPKLSRTIRAMLDCIIECCVHKAHRKEGR
jgi:cold shock CspA family protein